MGNPLQMEVYSLEAHRSKWGLLQHAMLINSPFPNYLSIYIYMYYHLSLSKFSRLANSLGFSVSPPPFFSGPAPHHARLAGCIFVQNVEAPALAVTIPVLTRGLNDKNEEVKRTCCQPLERVGVVVPGGARWWFWMVLWCIELAILDGKNIRVMEQHIYIYKCDGFSRNILFYMIQDKCDFERQMQMGIHATNDGWWCILWFWTFCVFFTGSQSQKTGYPVGIQIFGKQNQQILQGIQIFGTYFWWRCFHSNSGAHFASP